MPDWLWGVLGGGEVPGPVPEEVVSELSLERFCSESLGLLDTEERLVSVSTFTATIFASTRPF